jgi:hypothetical protein
MSRECLHPEELANLVEQMARSGVSDPDAHFDPDAHSDHDSQDAAPDRCDAAPDRHDAAPDRHDAAALPWRHLQSCPRCRALVTSYRTFMEADEIPAGADLADARARMRQALAWEVQRAEEDNMHPFRRAMTGLVENMWSPAWKPALAAAALLVIVFGIYRFADQGPGRQGPPVLRGEPQVREDIISGTSAVVQADGSYRLTWSAVTSVDSYLVIFYDTNLMELEPISAGASTELVLDPGWSDRFAAAGPRFWRVLGLRARDEVVRSNLTGLPDR